MQETNEEPVKQEDEPAAEVEAVEEVYKGMEEPVDQIGNNIAATIQDLGGILGEALSNKVAEKAEEVLPIESHEKTVDKLAEPATKVSDDSLKNELSKTAAPETTSDNVQEETGTDLPDQN